MSSWALPEWMFRPPALISAGIGAILLVVVAPREFVSYQERSKPLHSPQCFQIAGKSMRATQLKSGNATPQQYITSQSNLDTIKQDHVSYRNSAIKTMKLCPRTSCDAQSLQNHQEKLRAYIDFRSSHTFRLTEKHGARGLAIARQIFNEYDDQRIILDFRARVEDGMFSRNYMKHVSGTRMLAMRSAAEFRPCNSDEVP
jgi:hypothetical protein